MYVLYVLYVLYVCMYVCMYCMYCMYVCMYVCMYACTYVCMHFFLLGLSFRANVCRHIGQASSRQQAAVVVGQLVHMVPARRNPPQGQVPDCFQKCLPLAYPHWGRRASFVAVLLISAFLLSVSVVLGAAFGLEAGVHGLGPMALLQLTAQRS